MHKRHQKRSAPEKSAGKPTITAAASVASAENSRRDQTVSAEEIRLRAYGKWESAGRPIGDGIQFWVEAEQELRKRRT